MKIRNILILLAILIVLGGYFYFSSVPEPAETPEPRLYVWLVEDDEIQHVKIELPRLGQSQAFIKLPQEDRFPWFFDDAEKSEMDSDRWGGGIPLLLSGPGADRVISENTSEEKLTEFGLTQPRMIITITLEYGEILIINVGDTTPDGVNLYVQAPGSNAVALVSSEWYDVLARLVTEPPYPQPSEE
ncbi:DUF4340 domain-containing protein [Chloroflexota bacterium]